MDKEVIQSLYRSKVVSFEYSLSDILHIIQQGTDDLEGNAFYYHNSHRRFQELLPKQMNLLWAGTQVQTKLCEIGFNAGHSALLLLSECPNPDISFTIFDIGAHSYTRPCINYIYTKYPHTNLTYVEGDSLLTLPSFLQTKSEECGTYDVVHVDGGHSLECITSDFACATKLVRPGGIVIVDDTNVDYIQETVDTAIQAGVYTEIDCFPTVGYQHRLLRKV